MASDQGNIGDGRTFARPHVGQWIKLTTGESGHVVFVEGAKDVVMGMEDERRAHEFVARTRASYGQFWERMYYIADVMVGGKRRRIETRDVEAVLDVWI